MVGKSKAQSTYQVPVCDQKMYGKPDMKATGHWHRTCTVIVCYHKTHCNPPSNTHVDGAVGFGLPKHSLLLFTCTYCKHIICGQFFKRAIL